MNFERALAHSVILFLCWLTVMSQSTMEEDQNISDKVNQEMLNSRLAKYGPDMRSVLSGLIRFQHAKRPDESYRFPMLSIANRSKGSAPTVDDPLAAALATGFLGSRGKRNDYDEIPVFANGFPAGRG
ncbi:uncharacterized protein [Parasteatoda tepidariorum]|uniref:Uncharacterized protein n=1 Tax=Parasteatoda tepidariorum TaxID=114398 RepID=A0A2L2YMZ5_PARTP|nr:uncharacterized protein LOC107439037 [Parasteatoda tepidariorum]XP_015906988.2 uncharacterized protein LOC107439037 [Parasteatoda tepidariorum]XP_042902945.1 uncharacterized protein LOC107439037 [Parasteatoda tepidariorum]